MRLPMGWKLVLIAGVTGMSALGQNVPAITIAPQQRAPQPTVVGGTVTGHVYASDTQRPARFADVELAQEADSSRGGRGGSRGPNYMTMARGRTALDGSFKIENVPPGDYFVVASMTGYISPLTVSRMNQTAIAGVPSAHVASNGTGDVVVSMERGAVVTGRVAYDDGTPVAGVPVRVSLVGATGGSGMNMGAFAIGIVGNFAFGGGNVSQTDDRGVFRVMGVPAGKYIVSTMVQTESIGEGRATRSPGFRGGMAPVLTIYAPATMHKSEGQAIDVHAGDTVDGIDIRVALNGLHTVKGVVEAKADGHMLNSGFVSLADATDNSSVRTAAVDPDGSFRMDYVPAGTYTLNVSGEDRTETASGGDRRGSTTTTKRYERATVNVTVGDHDAALDPVQLDETKSAQTQQAGNQ